MSVRWELIVGDVTWLKDQAGYLGSTAYPTWAGNSVLPAQVRAAENQQGPFIGIQHMKYGGDRFTIEAFSKTYLYEARQNQPIGAFDVAKIMQHEKGWVTSVTCKGYNKNVNLYNHRSMIRGTLVKVE